MDAIHIAAVVTSFLLAYLRLHDVARPIYSWLPAWAQPFAIAIPTVFPDLLAGLGLVETNMDLAVTAVAFIGAFGNAMRGAVPAAHFEKLNDDAKTALARARGTKRRSPPSQVTTAFMCLGALAIFAGNLMLSGCTPAQIKTVARGVNDIAADLCADYFSEKQKISFEEAAAGACQAREVLEPFIEQVLAAKQAAGASASMKLEQPAPSSSAP